MNGSIAFSTRAQRCWDWTTKQKPNSSQLLVQSRVTPFAVDNPLSLCIRLLAASTMMEVEEMPSYGDTDMIAEDSWYDDQQEMIPESSTFGHSVEVEPYIPFSMGGDGDVFALDRRVEILGSFE